MRRSIAGLLLLIVMFMAVPQPTGAASLSAVAVRPDRLASGVSDGRYLIIAEPTSVATESKVRLTFDDEMSIDPLPANILVSTASVPATLDGVPLVAWPIVGTSASSVTGQDVVIDSQDLSPGTRYAFYITGGVDNPSVDVEQRIDVATLDSGNTVIDSATTFVPFLDNDQVNVTATVGPDERDFNVSASTESSGTAAPGEVRTYTLTYGNDTASERSFTLEAEWTRGSNDDESEVFDVAEYVVDSVSSGHGSSSPTVDLDRRRITWNITNFPPHTRKTVTWQLKTADVMGTTDPLEYRVRGRIILPGVTATSTDLVQTYQYSETKTSCCVAPTPLPASPPPSPDTVEPSEGMRVTSVRIVEIIDTGAVVEIRTNQPAVARVRYGPEGSELTQETASTLSTTFHRLEMTGLNPDQQYVFTVEVVGADADGLVLRELFGFRTASRALNRLLDNEHTFITAQGVVLINHGTPGDGSVLLPLGSFLDATLPFHERTPARVELRFRHQQIQGITTAQAVGFVEAVRLLETEAGVYSGRVATPEVVGTYDIVYEIRDMHGNFVSNVLGAIRVTEPLTVVDTEGTPIEAAHMYIEMKDSLTGEYGRFPAESFQFTNPVQSSSEGRIRAVLPSGDYRMTVSALGYESTVHEFSFSPYEDETYPRIQLSPAPFTLGTVARYYLTIGKDTLATLSATADHLAASTRYFKLSMLLTAVLLSVLSGLLVLTLRGWTPILIHPFARFSRGRAWVLWIVSSFGHLLSDFVLVVLLAFDIVLILKLGFLPASWLLLLTCVNVVLWIDLKWAHWRQHFRIPPKLAVANSAAKAQPVV